jgi:hypothetical protein
MGLLPAATGREPSGGRFAVWRFSIVAEVLHDDAVRLGGREPEQTVADVSNGSIFDHTTCDLGIDFTSIAQPPPLTPSAFTMECGAAAHCVEGPSDASRAPIEAAVLFLELYGSAHNFHLAKSGAGHRMTDAKTLKQ